jgi:hypothetical protein
MRVGQQSNNDQGSQKRTNVVRTFAQASPTPTERCGLAGVLAVSHVRNCIRDAVHVAWGFSDREVKLPDLIGSMVQRSTPVLLLTSSLNVSRRADSDRSCVEARYLRIRSKRIPS